MTMSATVLQVAIRNWQCTTDARLWFLDTSNRPVVWFVFTVFHVIGWTLILGSTLLMDICELIGVKQVWKLSALCFTMNRQLLIF